MLQLKSQTSETSTATAVVMMLSADKKNGDHGSSLNVSDFSKMERILDCA